MLRRIRAHEVTDGPAAVQHFDIIRLLAALQVLQEHAFYWMKLPRPPWLEFVVNQFPGVPVFFIVSGFLVTASYVGGAGGTRAYFARRALRIFPGLWVNIGLLVLLLALTGSLAHDLSAARLARWLAVACASGADIYANFAVGRIVDPHGFYRFFPSLVLWTIPVELGFYVLVPLITWPAVHRPRRERSLAASLLCWSTASLLLMFVYGSLKVTHPDDFITKVLSVTTPTYLWYFLLGAACSLYWGRIQRLFVERFPLWFTVHLLLAGLDAALLGSRAIDFHVIRPLLPLHALTLTGVVLSFAFSWRKLGRLLHGLDLSYGTYLYHVPIMLTLEALGASRAWWWWPVVVAVPLLLAAVSWFGVERPALRLKSVTDRWLAPRPPATAAA